MEPQSDQYGPLPPHRVVNGKIEWLPGSGAGWVGVDFLNQKYGERILGVKPNTTAKNALKRLSSQNIEARGGVPIAPEKKRMGSRINTGEIRQTLQFGGSRRKTLRRRMHRKKHRTTRK